jgi:hypothetical protein
MSRRRTWLMLVLAACAVVVCCRQAYAVREVQEAPVRRVCVIGMRVDLVEEPAAPGHTRPLEVDGPCGMPTVPLGLPGGGRR